MLYKALSAVKLLCGGLIVFISAFLKASPTEFHPSLSGIVKSSLWLQTSAWWLIPVLAGVSGVARLWQNSIGVPWAADHLQHLIDVFQKTVFPKVGGIPQHHRVTLFKYVKRPRCWQLWRPVGWLIPVIRSGHTSKISNAIFRAPDDADQAEGVAGMIWASKRLVIVKNLPDISNELNECDVEQYAREANVTAEWLKENRPCARSFAGFHVEAKSKVWGVIVIDSRDPEMGNVQAVGSFFEINGRYLDKLLERL